MPSFNYQAALKAGYTKDQIDQYLNSSQASQDINNFVAPSQSPTAPAAASASQQPTDIYSQIGQGAANLLGGIVRPFADTGRNILTAAATPLAVGANLNAQTAANQNVPEFLRNIAGAESRFTQNAFKKLQDMGILTSEEKIKQAEEDPTQFVKNQVADSGEIISYGIPLGSGALGAKGAKGLTGVAIKYALPGASVAATNAAAEQLRNNEFNPAQLAGKTIVGGTGAALLGPTMDKILGAGKTTEKLGQAAEDLGTAVRSGQRKIHAPASIYGAKNEKAINTTLDKLGISGTPQQQYEQLLPTMDKLGSQIDSKLAAGAKDYSIDAVKKDFMTNVQHNLRTSDINKKQTQEIINKYIDDISNVSGLQLGDKTNTRDLSTLKQFVNEDYKKIADKIDRGVSLTPQEEVISQARKTLDDIIGNLNPEVKNLTLQQSHLFDAARSLSPARFNPPTLRAGGFSIPSAVSQPVTDMAGRGLQGAGQKLQNLGAVLPQGSTPAIQNAIGQISARAPSVIGGNSQNQGQTVQDQGYGTNGQQQTNGNINQFAPPTVNANTNNQQVGGFQITPEILQAARMKLSDSEYKKIKDTYDIQQGDFGLGKSLTEAEVSRKQTSILIDDALAQINNNKKIKTGFEAPFENLKSKINMGDQATLDFNATIANLAATIAKARGGTSFTPTEKEMLNKYTPQVGDSYQDLVTKLTKLKSLQVK